MQDLLIATIFEHSVFGHIIQPMLASYDKATRAYTITETVSASSLGYNKLSDKEKKITQLANGYSDKHLMKTYSREKSEKEFIKNVEPKTVETYIRPFIENRHRKILDLIRETKTHVFIRKKLRDRVFAKDKRIEFLEAPSQIQFIFNNGEIFTYTIQVKNKESSISLLNNLFIPLHLNPAQVIIGNQLHYFEDADYKKLLPFINKSYIEIPQRSVSEYIRKFVVSCVKNFDVLATGIEIHELKQQPKPLLSLVTGLNLQPVLHLKFQYGNQIFSYDKPYKKEVVLNENNEQYSIGWFYRDREWEKKTAAKLVTAGLDSTRAGLFTIKKSDENPKNKQFLLLEWINSNIALLEDFKIDQSLGKITYYLGEIDLQISTTSLADWFDLECIVVFDRFEIPFTNFKDHILNNNREYILPDGTIAVLPEQWFARFEDLFRYGRITKKGIRLKRFHSQIKELAEKGNYPIKKEYENQAPVFPSDALQATLRPYQLTGFRWLEYLHQNNFGGCLADDMGLGKTLQSIALLLNIYSNSANKDSASSKRNQPVQLSLFDSEPAPRPDILLNKNTLPSLIIMPTSLIHNWQNELNKFAPSLNVYTHTGANRLRDTELENVLSKDQIILTSYGIIRQDINLLKKHLFYYIILDESQYIKNPVSQTFKYVKQLNSIHKLALTGTPIENSLSDLWAQMDFINNGILGTLNEFTANFNRDDIVTNEERKQALLQIISPFMLRRTKEQVAPELPPLTEEIRYCGMSAEQKLVYEEEKNKVRNALIDQFSETNKSSLNAIALSSLTRLRMLANHPVITAEEYDGESGKFNEIIEQAEILFSEGHKVLIFSSFVKHLRLLANHFETRQWKYAWLSGSSSSINREEEINRFNNDESIQCFFISLKAGGTGLNLTAANYVFIIDPWWNPASERQAVSRAHRIGQEKKVTLYRFITKNTIEEKIIKLQNYKDALSDAVVRPKLSKETIEHLLT